MTLEVTDFLLLIGLTSTITTASTTVIVLSIKDKLKEDICTQITSLLVRVGVLEERHLHESR